MGDRDGFWGVIILKLLPDTNIKVILKDKPNKASVRNVTFRLFYCLVLGELAMRFLEEIKKWLGEITEIFLLLIAVGIAVEILFGATAPFFGSILPNLTGLINGLGENGLVGLIALSVIFYLFYRKKAVA